MPLLLPRLSAKPYLDIETLSHKKQKHCLFSLLLKEQILRPKQAQAHRVPRAFKQERGDKPKAKRSYGQNFLKSSDISSQIVGLAYLKATDNVLEIGPGTGMLTAELLKSGAQVIAIENDHALMEGLQQRFLKEIASGQMRLEQGDATRMDLRHLLSSLAVDSRWKVVANLPFNITTDILKILLPMGHLISDVLVMLQLEAAQRLTGETPGNESFRAMSVLVEFYSEAQSSLIINRTAFDPQPNVDCQMVNFRLKEQSQRFAVPSEEAFLRLLNISFSARRKTLQNNLKAVYPLQSVVNAIESLGLSKKIRPQELHAKEYAALCRELAG